MMSRIVDLWQTARSAMRSETGAWRCLTDMFIRQRRTPRMEMMSSLIARIGKFAEATIKQFDERKLRLAFASDYQVSYGRATFATLRQQGREYKPVWTQAALQLCGFANPDEAQVEFAHFRPRYN